MQPMSKEMDAQAVPGEMPYGGDVDFRRVEALRSESAITEIEQMLRDPSAAGRKWRKSLSSLKGALADAEAVWVGVFNHEQVALWRLQGALSTQDGEDGYGSSDFRENLNESMELRSKAVLGLAEALQITKRVSDLPENTTASEVLSLLVRRRELLRRSVEAARESERQEGKALSLQDETGEPRFIDAEVVPSAPTRSAAAKKEPADPPAEAPKEKKQSDSGDSSPAPDAGTGRTPPLLESLESSVMRFWGDIRKACEEISGGAEERIRTLEREQEESRKALLSERDEALRERDEAREERDGARGERDEARRERDRAVTERDEARGRISELEEKLKGLESEFAAQRKTLEESLASSEKERDEVMTLVESALKRLKSEKPDSE